MSDFSIPLTGLSANDPTPGTFTEVNLGAGPASSGQGTYNALILANALATGSLATKDTVVYGPDTPTPLTNEADAIALFGAGSEAHRLCRRFWNVNQSTPLYVVAVSEGGGAAKATGTLSVAGTATGNCTLRVRVQDETVDVGIASGDTGAVVLANVAAAVNGKSHWAVEAATDGTLIAKNGGLRGNDIRYSIQMIPNASGGFGFNISPTAQTLMTGGTTQDSNVTALATVSSTRYYYVISAAHDATQLGAAASQVDNMAAPIIGKRQRCFGGSFDTVSNANAIAVGLNKGRSELVWQQDSDWTPAELAANAAAVYSLEEAPAKPRLNFSGYGQSAATSAYWKVPAPTLGTKPSYAQIKSALNNGVTPIATGKGSNTYLVKRITTRSLNGAVSDYRIRDAHKVTVCDRYADDLSAKVTLQLNGKALSSDPARGQRVPGADVARPAVLKALINQLTLEYGNEDLLQNVSQTQADTIVIRESSNPSRMSARVPLQPIDILDQVALAIDQVG